MGIVKRVWVSVFLLLLAFVGCWKCRNSSHSQTKYYTCAIRDSFPHDESAYTQGLLFDGGYFFESTGGRGQSSLRKVDPYTGRINKIISLNDSYFAEGLALTDGKLVQLTWKSGIGFVYKKDTFEKVDSFRYRTQGWGLCEMNKKLVMSDGSNVLRVLDPDSFSQIGKIVVCSDGVRVKYINELEYVDGMIYANIWGKDQIIMINPSSGDVEGRIDISLLRKKLGNIRSAEVANGIAWDRENKRLFITGKYWDRMFEITLVETIQ